MNGWMGWGGWAEKEGGGLGMGGKLTGMSVKKNSVKKKEKRNKYIGDAASSVPITNGVIIGIAYVTGVVIVAHVVVELRFFERKLAF